MKQTKDYICDYRITFADGDCESDVIQMIEEIKADLKKQVRYALWEFMSESKASKIMKKINEI